MASIADVLGFRNSIEVYNHFWKNHGFAVVGYDGTTESVQRKLARPENREKMKGYVAKKIGGYLNDDDGQQKAAGSLQTKAAITSSTVTAAVPLVYDPEILDILRTDAPLMAEIPIVGWPGTYYKGANIATRDHPIGFLSENDSVDVTALTRSGFALSPVEMPMRIQADVVGISDFGQRSSEHQFSLRDTALGARFSEAVQLKEQAMLYGNPTSGVTNGGLTDGNAPTGFAKQFDYGETGSDPDGVVDKSSVSLSASDALLKDIKAEIKGVLKSYNVTPSDLFIGTSWDVHDELDNEINVHGRTEVGQGSVNYGAERLSIMGIPVIPTHNIKEHALWTSGTIGSEGDVFILNKRAHIIASLAPPFILPLGRRGLSDEWVMGDYYCVVDRSGGKFGKYLQGYDI
ncbi:MAG: hypothetical protein WC912_08875 [Thermovirgaceae bacterium]